MKSFHRENLLYLLAFALALVLRVYHLGALPLTDPEAQLALQALGTAQGARPVLSSPTAYILPTALLFFTFGGGNNFLARIIPALAGTLLVLVPRLFRERLKPRPGLILAFFFALDPGLLALSRQAGGTILALVFVLFAWGFWEKRQPRPAGVFAALALMSGPALWAGLLGLGLTWAIRQGIEARRAEKAAGPGRVEWRTAVWSGLGTLVLSAVLLLLSPNGLTAWASALPDYVSGWGMNSGVSRGMLLAALAVYQPLGVILGLTALIRGWIFGSRRVIGLSLWGLVALLLALFYPARQVSDLAWVLVPLCALASLELARHLDLAVEERAEVAGGVILVAFVLMAAWISLASIAQNPLDPTNTVGLPVSLFGKLSFSLPPRPVSLLLVLLFILVVSVLLIAMGWSIRLARLGAVWGLALTLGVYTFAAAWSAAGLRTPSSTEMWVTEADADQSALLLMTADQLSDWTQGNKDALPVTIAGIRSPALQWLLRGHPVEVIDSPDPASAPPLIITGQLEDPGLAAPYRGQDFTWGQHPLWDGALPGDWLRWIVFRQMPQTSETIILWARNDLFPDSAGTAP